MLTYEIHGRVPSGILTSADAPFIDLNVPFEIQDGELLIVPPPSAWHDATSQSIREYLKPRHAHVAQVARDRETKFREYATAGIPEYWLVDEVTEAPHDASVEIYRLQATAYVPVTVARLSELTRSSAPPD